MVLAKKLARLELVNKAAKNTKVKTVGILTTDTISKKIKLQKLVEDSLQIKNAKIYNFRKFDKENEISLIHFSENEFAKSGKIIEENFNNFVNQPFDVLICFFDTNNLYLEYSAAISKANFKVGFSKVNPDLFDLEIHSNVYKAKEFLSELKKYLGILNKLDNN